MKEQYCVLGAALFYTVVVKQGDANMPGTMCCTSTVNKCTIGNLLDY